ncbi:peptidyl-prolyl cis-trans isomerase [Haloferula sp. A504]|uniref:peptidylprolyl isomerase n=1 Tax=Haloferula sp. A504 TaxID=3373601 RepID=UPI0031C12E33|nr:peptidylprolyl isomerase [Verrucomicrobiaceae bacterium E54]
MFSKLHILPMLLAAPVLLTGCGEPPSETDAAGGSPVLATVAGEPVTEADLLAEAKWRMERREAIPSTKELLDELIQRRALLAKARSEGFDEDPDTRRRMENLLIAALRERDLEPAVANAQVSDEELREEYENRSAELGTKDLDRFAILFLEADEKRPDDYRAEVRSRLEEGVAKSDANPAPGGRGPAAGGFGAIAVDYSDDQAGRYRGGDIGWIEAGAGSARVPDSILEVGRSLEPGARSGIIEAPEGFYVIMKTDSRPGGLPAFEKVSARLYQDLLIAKRQQLQQDFMADILSAAEISIDADALAGVELPASSESLAPPVAPTGPAGVPSPAASR